MTTATTQSTTYTFTLTFRNDRVAVVVVNGATNAAAAEQQARSGFAGCLFDLVPGDTTNGAVVPFYTRAYTEPCFKTKRNR